MSYSEDLRKKVIEYLSNGHSQRSSSRAFSISLSTVNKWHQKHKRTGELTDPPPRRSFRKIDPERLETYLQTHPDAYLKEISEEFGCSESGVRYALKLLNITRKKRQSDTGNRTGSV
jgi:transposase